MTTSSSLHIVSEPPSPAPCACGRREEASAIPARQVRGLADAASEAVYRELEVRNTVTVAVLCPGGKGDDECWVRTVGEREAGREAGRLIRELLGLDSPDNLASKRVDVPDHRIQQSTGSRRILLEVLDCTPAGSSGRCTRSCTVRCRIRGSQHTRRAGGVSSMS